MVSALVCNLVSRLYLFDLFFFLKGDRGEPGQQGPPGESGLKVTYKEHFDWQLKQVAPLRHRDISP